MAHIQKRRNGKWQARYRAPDGRERTRQFDRQIDAQNWLDLEVGRRAKGEWIDPTSAKTTVETYAREWQQLQVARDSTREQVASHLAAHILPRWGHRALGTVTRGEVQQWVNELAAAGRAPSYVEGIYRRFAAVLASAVDDRLIGSSPCRRITLPERPHQRVHPVPHETIRALADAMPARARAAVYVAAGAGLRQGEALGLTVDRINFLRREIRVDQQLVTLRGVEPQLRPPKTKASVRVIPVSREVTDLLATHLAEYPAVDGLVFSTEAGRPWRRNRFGDMFATARIAAGVDGVRFHDLRHFFASVLIDAGEGPQVIKERMGHASITETYDTYGHLFPSSDDRTRSAVADAMQRILAGPPTG